MKVIYSRGIVYRHFEKITPKCVCVCVQVTRVWKCKKYYLTSRKHDEIKSRLNSGNTCYYSVQNLLSSRLISRNLKIKIYKTVILPVVLYGWETWSLTLREEHRLRVFENRVLRRIFGPRSEEDGSWRKLHNDELHNLYSFTEYC
jgi:hypothetical protein